MWWGGSCALVTWGHKLLVGSSNIDRSKHRGQTKGNPLVLQVRGLGLRLRTIFQKTIYVKKPNSRCQMREKHASVVKEATVLRGLWSQDSSEYHRYCE
jgi:hypothetical protein